MGNCETRAILRILDELYPNPQTELNFETPFQLLVATILSAQTTDRQVNAITAELFRKYATPRFCCPDSQELEREIRVMDYIKTRLKILLQPVNYWSKNMIPRCLTN